MLGCVLHLPAAVGVILDQRSNSQSFFGSGQVENTSKQTSSTKHYHSDDITALGWSKDRTKVVTGQNGSRPVVFVWDSSSGEKIQRFQMFKGGRSVKAASISADGSLVAMACDDNDHHVLTYNIDSGDLVYKEKGGPDPIFDLYWS